MMGWNFNGDGTLQPFTPAQIAAMGLKTVGVKDGSHPSMTLGSRENTIHREWVCHWGQQENAICVLLGGAAIYSGGSGLMLSRVMPTGYPGKPRFVAVEIEHVRGDGACGKDDANGVPAYTKARMMVRHELVFFQLAADDPDRPEYGRYVEPMPSTVETQTLTIPGTTMVFRTQEGFAPNGQQIPYTVGRPETVTKIGRKWHRVPRTAWENAGNPLRRRVFGDGTNRGYIDTVNKTEIFGRPPGTLLLTSVDEEQVGDPTAPVAGGLGDYAYNLTFWWLERPTFHNYLYTTARLGASGIINLSGYYLATVAGTWQANGSIVDGTCLFDERDHTELFKVGV